MANPRTDRRAGAAAKSTASKPSAGKAAAKRPAKKAPRRATGSAPAPKATKPTEATDVAESATVKSARPAGAKAGRAPKSAGKAAAKVDLRGRSLVIVESPTKSRTLTKFLGRGFSVLASNGHIMDLPKIGRAHV